MKYRIFDIRYDTDGEDVELPSELFVPADQVEDYENPEDELSDAISDITGWCHLGFKYELLED